MKGFSKILGTFCLTAAVNTPLSFAAEAGVTFGLELRPLAIQTFPNYLPQITNIPASARTVPINPDDANAGTPVLIPNATVKPGSYAPFSVAVAPEMRYRRLTLRAGFVMSPLALAPTANTGSFGSTQEQNYQGSGRTVGAALVYYAGVVRPSIIPGVLGEVDVRVAGGFSVLAGYQRSTADVSIQQGWDRFNSLATYRTLVLSQDLLQQGYAGIKWTQRSDRRFRKSLFLYAGPAFLTKAPTPLGKAAVIGYNPKPWFIGTGFGWDWDWHRKSVAKAP